MNKERYDNNELQEFFDKLHKSMGEFGSYLDVIKKIPSYTPAVITSIRCINSSNNPMKDEEDGKNAKLESNS